MPSTNRKFQITSFRLHSNQSDFISLGHEITSSLPLQMSLYFNAIIFPLWILIIATMLFLKYQYLTTIYKFIIILTVICLTVIECVRLYLGYLGNLSEKVWIVLWQGALCSSLFIRIFLLEVVPENSPEMNKLSQLRKESGTDFENESQNNILGKNYRVPELAGFWVLSVILQLPLHLLLLFSAPVRLMPGEIAVEIVMLALLVSQLVAGFFALRKSALHQARRYHLAQVQNKSTEETNSN